MKIHVKVFYKRVVSFLLVLARHVQSTQNKGRDEVDFLPADKHETILQVDNINLGGHGQAFPNYPK